MQPWAIILIGIVVITTVMYFARTSVEGFGFKDEQMKFTNEQNVYFHDTAGKAIFTNPGLNLTGLNAAFAQPDLYLPKSPERDYTRYFQTDPENAYVEKDNEIKGATHPRNLPKRDPNARVGVGWYFVPDLSVPSRAALGTVDGPLFPGKLPANGEWIWNLEEAAKKQDIKFCKRITSCANIGLDGIRGVCGFCERLGYAVPINTNGTEKYPDSEDGACGASTIKSASQCVKPTPPSITTADGIECGTAGFASPDGALRLYTRAECDALGGIYNTNGECTTKSGGSYSWSCRALNTPATLQNLSESDFNDFINGDADTLGGGGAAGAAAAAAAAKADVCSPSGGRLSRKCLISLASGLGFTRSGALLRVLETATAPGWKDKHAIEILEGAGLMIPAAVLGSGDIDSQSAGNIYNKIYNAMSSGSRTIVREAAKYMVSGSENFDICAIDGKDKGPFRTDCLQRAFREEGCQPAGSKHPSDRTAGEYANMTWTQVHKTFSDIADRMKSSDAKVQDKAMTECLGITYVRAPGVQDCIYRRIPGGYENASNFTRVDGISVAEAKDRCAKDSKCFGFNVLSSAGETTKTTVYFAYDRAGSGIVINSAYTGYSKVNTPAAPNAGEFKVTNAMIKSDLRPEFCMDILGMSKNNDANAVGYDCHGGTNQQFTYDPAKQTLKAAHSSKCLDAQSWGTTAGTPIVQWDCSGGANQRWTVDAKRRLHPDHAPSKCMSLENANNLTQVRLAECNDSPNQKWTVSNLLTNEFVAGGARFLKEPCMDRIANTILVTSAEKPEDCAAKCAGNQNCQYFTHVNGTCFLKNGQDKTGPVTCAVTSGKKL